MNYCRSEVSPVVWCFLYLSNPHPTMYIYLGLFETDLVKVSPNCLLMLFSKCFNEEAVFV
jgi:hypothetical protein